MHPTYRDLLRDDDKEALARGDHTPHVLEKAFSWHENLRNSDCMLRNSVGATKIKA